MKYTTMGTTTSAPVLGLRITLAMAALVALAAVAGCGGDGVEQASNATSETQTGSVPAMPAMIVPSTPPEGSRVIALGDSLPPDVAATVEDTLFNPGDVVEITAQGSEDVSQIGLSDGLGRMQLFSRDPASNVWHVLYRVPIRTTKDRVALSVTALNDVNRWRRVWVFLDIRQAETAAKSDSLIQQ